MKIFSDSCPTRLLWSKGQLIQAETKVNLPSVPSKCRLAACTTDFSRSETRRAMTWNNWFDQRLEQRRAQHLWRKRISLSSPQGTRIQVNGRDLINFCSNDYLGLANHPAVIESGIKALQKWGVGSGASHLICGHSELHDQLETELAQFVEAERAVLFSTGYMANLAIPQTFLGRHDLLLEDKLNHASLIDAGQLTAGAMERYPHLDFEAAERMLAGSSTQRKILVTDGVFSMDGDLAPVVELRGICRAHDTLLVVDDAHGFGVLGDAGGGLLQELGIPIGDHVAMVGTLGKAGGSFGAFIAGEKALIENLIQFARSYIYTTALPPVVAGMTLASLAIMRSEPERRDRLRRNIAHFRNAASSVGLNSGESLTPIQPLFLPDKMAEADRPTSILRLSQKLYDSGFWVSAIRPPTVPFGTERLRITLSSEHTAEQIDRLVDVLHEKMK